GGQDALENPRVLTAISEYKCQRKGQVPEKRAHKFPTRLHLFGLAIGIQRIRTRNRNRLTVCEKCFGFHSTRSCIRQQKCEICGSDAHEEPCVRPEQCLNCRGPHKSTEHSCPTRLMRDHGVLVRPTAVQMRHIQALKNRNPRFMKTRPSLHNSLLNHAKVGRGSNANSIALQLAHENDIDILLVQEPWVFRDLAVRRSISHPIFMSFSPLSEWYTCPRALTYVRKSRGLYPYQTAIDLSSDWVQINISAGRGRRIGIWNLYNAPANCIGAGDGLKLLLELPDSTEFVGGDFNLRHPAWDSYITSTSTESTALIDWARKKDLCLLNPTDNPTHNRGTIVSTISLHGNIFEGRLGRLRYDSLDETRFLTLLGHRRCPQILESIEDLEAEAKNIIQTIHTALLASCPRSKRKGKGTTWWNEECRAASRSYCVARRLGRLGNEKRNFQNATNARRTIPWHSFTEREVFRATCQVTSSSPGEDEITAPVLRLTRPIMGQRITSLFNKCASLGVHPQVFKRAEVVILPKPGKRDRSLPKSYRPISLLSCLGKGLERLFARRLFYWATKCNILARDQLVDARQQT
ncbi:hypothetical protein EPUL_005139, partial [Erysiphe pulchra]